MFKKGQMVRGLNTGRMYKVLRHKQDGLVVAYPLLHYGRVGWPGRVEMVASRFELIGNNYKPKLTDKK